MVRSGPDRSPAFRSAVLAAIAGIFLVLLAWGTAAADTGEPCDVRVSPRAAPAGSVFSFTGSGFAPTRLALQKAGGELVAHALEGKHASGWEVTVRSRVGDEGAWTATFSVDDGCTAAVEFRVTLSNTDAAGGAAGEPSGGKLAIASLVAAIGAVGGIGLGRRVSHRQPARVRA